MGLKTLSYLAKGMHPSPTSMLALVCIFDNGNQSSIYISKCGGRGGSGGMGVFHAKIGSWVEIGTM